MDAIVWTWSIIIGALILWGIISVSISGIKKELRRQTLIMGLMAQKEGITADELNQIMK
jgi:hypothetical protein